MGYSHGNRAGLVAPPAPGENSLSQMRLAGKFQSHIGWIDVHEEVTNIQDSLRRAPEQGRRKVDSKSIESKWRGRMEDEPGKPAKNWDPNGPNPFKGRVYQRAFRPGSYFDLWPVWRAFILGTVDRANRVFMRPSGVCGQELPGEVTFFRSVKST